MAHYVEIGYGDIVTDIFVGRDEDDLAPGVDDWETYYSRPGFLVKRTSYNTRGGVHYTDGEQSADQTKAFRKNYAGIGYTYDEERDAFIPPQPYESWVINEDTCLWDAPVPMPEGGTYTWNEELQEWTAIENETE